VRLIGNKTRLLDAIEGFLAERGIVDGTLLDVFAGTASVGRHFRRRGFKVRTNDLMMSSYVRQRAYITLSKAPDMSGVLAERAVRRFLASKAGQAALAEIAPLEGLEEVRQVLAYLGGCVEPEPGLIAGQYAEGGHAERLYFSADNGARIDAIHAQLVTWRRRGRLDDDGFYVLLTALLEAADRAANISGTYGAFLKKLQRNALEPLRLRVPELDLRGPAGRAYQGDANRLAARLRVDTLYMDPPYNGRQYAKNYHVMEVLAELHTVDDLEAYQEGIYGKTGLRKLEDRLSSYCRKNRRSGQPSAADAFRDLVKRARAEHVVISYSEEGILSREDIGQALADAAGLKRFDFARDHAEVSHKRFRSDSDGAGRRSYRVLQGRRRDEVREWLFYVHKPRVARSGPVRRAS
jgi:adenine-specific DNA-methyltransferase